MNQVMTINQIPQEERTELYSLYTMAQHYNPNGWHVEWNEGRTVYVDELRQSSLSVIANSLLSPAINAMTSASGLTKEQAKTCVYYAVATFLQDDYSELMPILCLQGNSGTGKSAAMNQIEKLVKEPKRIVGRTYSQVGLSLNRAITALIEEGDFNQNRIETELMQLRCCKDHAEQIIHVPRDMHPVNVHNFGATVIVKRKPFTDTATRNRTITIKTKRRPIPAEGYHQVDINNQDIRTMAEIIRQHRREVDTSDRVSDAWKPITEIATTIGDADWLSYQLTELRKAQQMLSVGDQYEPEDVLIKAIMTCCNNNFTQNIKLHNIKITLESNFDTKWSTQQIHAMVASLGFTTGFSQGYDKLRANNELLTTLAEERGIRWELETE